jgi:hypothetical protein
MVDQLFLLFSRVLNVYVAVFQYVIFWGPLVLLFILWRVWLSYIRAVYLSKIEWVMLEVKLPREITKSPLAMELLLNVFYQTSKGTWYDEYFKGRVRDWFSLEIVSLGGAVKFFIRTNKVYKNLIESQIYAQYPQAEVYEVPDYTRYVDYHGKGSPWEIFGTDFILSKEDAYPIKTYVDYGLDKESMKEEHKTDPMTATLEFMGTMGKDEQLWLQILVRAAEDRHPDPKSFMGWGKRSWKDEGKDLIDEIMKKAQPKGEGQMGRFLTNAEQDLIKALSRSISKFGFDTGIRAMYLAKKDSFNGAHIKGLMGILRQYATGDLNSFKPARTTSFDFPWQDYNKIRTTKKKVKFFNAYIHRGYFYKPYQWKPFILNTEELATIFHFPGGVLQTPTFGRIESRKVEPPTNLPV